MTTRRWLMDEWRDAFLIQARMDDLPGAKIGEALAEIDAHCADSGEHPDEAFGDPVEYAKALTGSQQPASLAGGWGRPWRNAPTTFATLSGIMCLVNGVDAVAHGTGGVIIAGQLVFVPAGVVLTALIVTTAFAAAPRPGRRSRTWWLVTAMALGAVAVFGSVSWQQVAVRAPGWVLLTAGVSLLMLVWWPMLSGEHLADPVIDPRTGRQPFRESRRLLAVVRWSLPVALLFLALLIMLPTAWQ